MQTPICNRYLHIASNHMRTTDCDHTHVQTPFHNLAHVQHICGTSPMCHQGWHAAISSIVVRMHNPSPSTQHILCLLVHTHTRTTLFVHSGNCIGTGVFAILVFANLVFALQVVSFWTTHLNTTLRVLPDPHTHRTHCATLSNLHERLVTC